MSSRFASVAWAIAFVALTAILVAALHDSAGSLIVVLVGGSIAVVLAARHPRTDEGRHAGVVAAPVREPVALGEVLDAVVEPILLVRDGRVAFANRAALALLGNHIVDEDVRVAIRHPAAAERLGSTDPQSPDRPIELVGLGTPDQRWEMRIGQASNGQRIVHLIDQTGNYAAERMRVDFVANASHELRTPLASILGFIETLDGDAGDEPAIRARFLKVMFDEARRMQRLVEDLISLSRIEAEKYRPPSTPVDLAALIADVCAEMRRGAGERGDDLDCDIDDDLPPLSGDAAQLSQMLHNLVGNALKYGRKGTPVTIRLAREAGNMLRLSVRDEGDGIAPEHLPRLTERFYRVDPGRSRGLGGTGLGLAIVKHIVERHRGRLDITSRVGMGTTFAVIFAIGDPVSSPRNANVTGNTGLGW